MQAKLSLVFKIFIFILPVALILSLVNWYVDPGLVFKAHTYEDQLSDTLLSNKNAVINTNFNDRILERDLVNKLKIKPKTIILGTSRIMELEKNFFCNDTIFNSAVTGGRLEDIVAIFGLYAKRGIYPKRVILNMEPTFFNLSTDPPLWVDLSDEYVYMLNNLQLKPEKPIWMVKTGWEGDRYLNLLSFGYFRTSLHRFAHNLKDKNESVRIITSPSAYNTGITRLSDGSMTYGTSVRNETPQQVLETAITTASKPLPGLTDYKPDDYEVKLFEKFIEYLQSKHIAVILTITPYHPVIYNEVATNNAYKLVLKNENYIRSFAASHHIFCLGSYNPERTHTTNSDFLDSFHLKTASLYRIFNTISGCSTPNSLPR
jgi:hypothetical protein